MWKEIYLELKVKYPYFEFKMIVTGHKWFGKWHIDLMMEHIKQVTQTDDEWI